MNTHLCGQIKRSDDGWRVCLLGRSHAGQHDYFSVSAETSNVLDKLKAAMGEPDESMTSTETGGK